MNQFGPEIDKQLNEASKTLGEIAEAQRDYDHVWERIANLFEEFRAYRFVAADGHTLVLQANKDGVELDAEELRKDIFATYSPTKAARIWNDITVRRVDSDKLNELVQRGRLDGDLVLRHLNTKPRNPSRIRREWTKEDHERAKIFGITNQPSNISPLRKAQK